MSSGKRAWGNLLFLSVFGYSGSSSGLHSGDPPPSIVPAWRQSGPPQNTTQNPSSVIGPSSFGHFWRAPRSSFLIFNHDKSWTPKRCRAHSPPTRCGVQTRRTLQPRLSTTSPATSRSTCLTGELVLACRKLTNSENIIAEINAAGKPVWEALGNLWPAVAESLDPSPKAPSAVSEEARVALAAATAKLERNLIAGLFENQQAAL